MIHNVARQMKRKGFTMVELLIVIVIIGIMSSMMMITTGSATDKAEATKIVADLRNIQSASVLYFADEEKWPAGDISEISKYLTGDLGDTSKYSFESGENSKLTAKYGNDEISAGVLSKLEEMQNKGTPISVDLTAKTVELVIRN